MLHLATLPDLSWLLVAGVVVVILGAIGLGVILRFMKELRTNLAEELKREFSAQREPSPVAVQSPLEVKEHQYLVTRDELQKVDTALHGRLKRERIEINEHITRVETIAAGRADKLEAKLDANTSMTQGVVGQVSQINQNVHLILSTLTKK